jgi:hypothetical protein
MNAENAIINYFIYKKLQSKEGYKYGYYKKIIGYILDTEDNGYIRKIFLNLIKTNNFLKIKNKNKKSYLYKFILHEEEKKEEKTYDKDFFIVSWA